VLYAYRVAIEGTIGFIVQADAQLELKRPAIKGGVHWEVICTEDAQPVTCVCV
jgi:hypothetical protein